MRNWNRRAEGQVDLHPRPVQLNESLLLDALRRNREPTLAGLVINHYMGGLAVSSGVGQGLTNNKADVLAVQDRLNFLKPYAAYTTERAAVAASTAVNVPDSTLTGTLAAIAEFKLGIASGTAGWLAVRATESEFGADRFAGQTTKHTVTVLANPAGARQFHNRGSDARHQRRQNKYS